jgi:hypothetical protein
MALPSSIARAMCQSSLLSFVQYGERREHCPVADFKLLIDVMEVHLDGAVGNIQAAPNFLVRQPSDTRDMIWRSRSVSTVSTFSVIVVVRHSRGTV